MSAPPVKRYEGASFISTDFDASRHFWVDFVGGELVSEGTLDGRLPMRIALGGVMLEFYQATAEQQPAPGSGSQHYCWDTEPTDFDFWVKHGLEWELKPESISFHANGKEMSIYWDDPDGYHFEVSSHFCTNVELMKQRAVRAKQFAQLKALPAKPFTKSSGPVRG
jgi:hypothetical protein